MRGMIGRGWMGRAVCGVLVTAAMLSIVPEARAQFRGGMGMRELVDPSLTTRDIERMSEKLKLNDDQIAAANDLLAAFQAQHSEMASGLRDAMESARQEFQETRDPSVWRDLRPIGEKAEAKLKTMEAAFFNDLGAVLEPAQTELLAEYQRSRKREKSLQQGFLSGEAVDIVRLVEDVKLSPESKATIEPTVKQYETEVERAASERDEIYKASMDQGMELWQQGQMDKVNELFGKARDAGLKVRDINRKYARLIEGSLSEEEKKKFNDEFLQRSFPRVYRPSYANRAVEMSVKMSDLTGEQKAQVDAIAEGHAREAAALNEKWAAAVEDSEKTRTIMQMFGGGMGNEDVRSAQRARRELDDKTVEKLRAVLTEEQAAKLPERQERDWRQGGGREGRDGA